MIETKRLILRKMTCDDFDALYRVLRDSELMCYHIRADKQRRGYATEAATFVFGILLIVNGFNF